MKAVCLAALLHGSGAGVARARFIGIVFARRPEIPANAGAAPPDRARSSPCNGCRAQVTVNVALIFAPVSLLFASNVPAPSAAPTGIVNSVEKVPPGLVLTLGIVVLCLA